MYTVRYIELTKEPTNDSMRIQVINVSTFSMFPNQRYA